MQRRQFSFTRSDGVFVDRISIDLITAYAPLYLRWLCRVVRDLIPLPATGSLVRSQSQNFSPGVIALSDGQGRCSFAESLVHEASHQYFYTASRVGLFEDGTDQSVYYSPFRNENRHIYNILLAYHAFGNVLLFYWTALEGGLARDARSGEVAKRRASVVANQLEPLTEALHTTTGLTALGRAMWEPLHQRLANLSLVS